MPRGWSGKWRAVSALWAALYAAGGLVWSMAGCFVTETFWPHLLRSEAYWLSLNVGFLGLSGLMIFGVLSRPLSHVARALRVYRVKEQRYQAFIANSSEAIWRTELQVPMPIDLPHARQFEHLMKHAYIAECNDAMAAIHGRTNHKELEGVWLRDLLPASPKNLELHRVWAEAGYRLHDIEFQENDLEDQPVFFASSLVGVVEGGMLERVWGTQRDITGLRTAEQEAKRQVARLLLLRRIDQSILGQTSVEAMLQAILKDVCKGRRVAAAAVHGLDEGRLREYAASEGLKLNARIESLRAQAVASQASIIGPSLPEGATLFERPLNGYICLPLR